MFERHMYKIISGGLALLCFLTGNLIITIMAMIFEIGMLIYIIKGTKDSTEDTGMVIIDMICAVVSLILIVIITVYEVAIISSIPDYIDSSFGYESQSKGNISIEEAIQTVIVAYKVNTNKNYSAKDFKRFLEREVDVPSTSTKISGNNVILQLNKGQAIFTVTKNNITYKIK